MAANNSYVPLFFAQLPGIETIQFDSVAGSPMRVIASLSELTDGMTIIGGAGRDLLAITAPQDSGTYSLPQLNLTNWVGGSDSVNFSATGTGDTTLLATNHTGTDTLVLVGNAGNNTLIGGPGQEVFVGGAGKDTMTGGGGADLFVLEAPHGQTLSVADVITDFQVGTDHMLLSSGLTFASLDLVQGNPVTNGGAVSEALVINHASGDILARLSGVDATTLTAAAFLASA